MQTRTYHDCDLFLLSTTELTQPASWPSLDPSLLPHFLLVLWWVESFLAKPHRDLGRAGPVCPFVGPSLERKTFWLTAVRGTRPAPAALAEVVLGYRDWFRELAPGSADEAQYKTILILLPDVAPEYFASVIDDTQTKLKPAFLQEQLMIGQFHPSCEEPGVKNGSFRPLQSPVPMLVIRQITAGDIVFMKDRDGQYNPGYLQSYLRTFAKGLPNMLVNDILGLVAKSSGQAWPPAVPQAGAQGDAPAAQAGSSTEGEAGPPQPMKRLGACPLHAAVRRKAPVELFHAPRPRLEEPCTHASARL